ncbi:hypothetical protein SETIT_1G152600v2 [Setaria italica]|uniref:F-box domain-containing protein n=1 Tax=Setaria italica TaxID=4555 RepID=A0A368PKK6_SETIT|nr:hypothetical protein SETIT_1G152600v2 [Setaria italica]
MDGIAKMLVPGFNFFAKDETMLTLMKSTFTNLSHPLAAKAAPLSGAVPARAPDGVDRISRLLAGILRNIVSRLPVKDAACTTVLSTRWRHVWHTAPLVLVDAHLLPASGTTGTIFRASTSSFRVGAAPRERDLTGAPARPRRRGLFCCVYLIGTPMERHQDKLALWLQHLFAMGIQELFFINRIWTFHNVVLLPATIFRY